MDIGKSRAHSICSDVYSQPVEIGKLHFVHRLLTVGRMIGSCPHLLDCASPTPLR